MHLTTARGRYGRGAVPHLKTEKPEEKSLKLEIVDSPEFPEKIEFKPRLVIGFKAFIKLNLLCSKIDASNPGYEIGGGGLITNPKNGLYRLEDVFVPPQVTQPAFNSLDFGELINQAILRYRVKDVRQVSFHFHKHPQSVTDFSGQDITQWHKILDFEQPFIFLLIFGHFNYDKWKAAMVHPQLVSSLRMNVGFDFPTKVNLKVDLSEELKGIETKAPEKASYGWSYGLYSHQESLIPAKNEAEDPEWFSTE